LALGQRATDRFLELLNAGSFEIVYKGGQDEDRHGRKLHVIERNGRSLGDDLVAEGLARRWDGARRRWCA
jgi:endonuclease YncB( thermonuclease family)